MVAVLFMIGQGVESVDVSSWTPSMCSFFPAQSNDYLGGLYLLHMLIPPFVLGGTYAGD